MANRFPLIINTTSGQIAEIPTADNLDLSGCGIYNGTATITLPTATGTLATLAGSETLSNKSITSSTFSGTTGSFSGQITSTVATGTAPLVVASTTKVANLNVELVDGYHAAETNTASNIVVRDSSSNINITGATFSGSTSGTAKIVASAAAGTGTTITLPATTGTVITTGDTGTVTNTMLAGSIANAKLANSTISGVALGSNLAALTIGTGLSGTSYNGSTAVTIALANTAVTAGSYGGSTAIPVITVDAQGRITAASTAAVSTTINLAGGTGTGSVSGGGTLTFTGGTGVTTSVSSSTATFSIGQAVATSSNVQFNSVGVGTAGSGTAGEIRATNAITSYYSDDRLKTRTGNIQNALEKVLSLDGFHYHANETAVALGYDGSKEEVGLSAQQVQAVLPEVIAPAPIDPQYMTLHYERIVPLLVEAIKEQQKQIEELKSKIQG